VRSINCVTVTLTGFLVLGMAADGVAQQADSTIVSDSLSGPMVGDSLLADSLAAALVLDPLAPPTLPTVVLGHLAAMTNTFVDTPNGMSLIQTGMVEAEIAAVYIRIAGQDSTDLRAMTTNMVNVARAIDPTEVSFGGGLGYGFKRAAEGVRTYIELASTARGTSETIRYHAPYITDAANGALSRVDEALALARRIGVAQDTETARPLLDDLAEVVRAMTFGVDRDRDGRIGSDPSEAGLAQARYHLEVIRRAERLGPEPALPDSLPIPEFVRDTASVGR